MARDSQLVSAVIPVCNGEKYLSAAIESVLAQTFPDIELIIVDDGSTDSSAKIAGGYEGAGYIYQPNKGVTAARNTGILSARGEFIAFLDQDDMWTPDKLKVQVGYLVDNPGAGYSLARQRLFLEPGTTAPSWLKKEFLFHDQAGYLPGTLVARRWAFGQVGLFDPAYRIGSDTDWLARARDLGIPMVILPEVLLLRRIHHGNQSARTDLIHTELAKILKASIDRRTRPKPGRGRE